MPLITHPLPALHHVNLRTCRQAEMIDWYGKLVGLTTVHRFPLGAWLTNDRANHRLALLSFPEISDDPDKQTHAGIDHLAFEFQSFAGLMENYGRLREIGIVPHQSIDHGMTLSLYYRDPDANLVELQVDVFGSWDLSMAFMADSPEFHANPLGHFFDPDRVYEDYRAGADLAEVRVHTTSDAYRPDPFPEIPFALPPGI